MKKLFCLLMIFLICLGISPGARADEARSIMLSPFVYLGGQADLHYERSLGKANSYLIDCQIIDNYNFNALSLGAGYRKYFGRENFSRAFGEGSLGLIYGIDDESKHHVGLALGGNLGYKWIFRHGFTLEAGAGMNFNFANNIHISRGRISSFRLRLGYSW